MRPELELRPDALLRLAPTLRPFSSVAKPLWTLSPLMVLSPLSACRSSELEDSISDGISVHPVSADRTTARPTDKIGNRREVKVGNSRMESPFLALPLCSLYARKRFLAKRN